MIDPDEGEEASLFPDDEAELTIAELPTVNAAEAPGVRKQRRTKAEREQEARNFWQAVFADPVGRREMWGILSVCHPFETKYGVGPTGFPNDKASDAYMAEQQIGLRLFLSWQAMDFDGVSQMVHENDPRFAAKPRK